MIGPGSRLAHYEIVSVLGRGGMGEVWRAKDSRLGREVAIKTLPAEFAQDEERLARFEREAKLLGSLNHPNIAAIYGLEEHEGSRFLVLELVEGDTLADRLERGAIPVEESLKLALQIAEALEAAHEKGVIHRDLKPANIKVTPEGRVKVLDFGLAKAFIGEHADVNLSNSPTLSMAATQQGVVLGTAAYMSPEQAGGEVADHRTDVWSFGVVLFEMLSGRKLFTGKNVTHILADVVKSDPHWDDLPGDLHPRIRLLLEGCLDKEPRDRLSSISDARVGIRKVLADSAGVTVAAPIAAAAPARSRWLWAGTAFALGLMIAGASAWILTPEVSLPITRFVHLLPEDQTFSDSLRRNVLALSPDGQRLVYAANGQLWMRTLDTLEATPIPGTDTRPIVPLWSPDGQWIAYFSSSDQQIKKIAVTGGAPITLTDAFAPFGILDWTEDNVVIWGQTGGIMSVSGDGGTAEILIEGNPEIGPVGAPQMLPGGDAMLLSNNVGDGAVFVHSMSSAEARRLLTGRHGRYVPTGHIVYELDGVLFAQRFDPDTFELSGGPVSLVEGVSGTDAPQFALSDTGSLAYVSGDASPVANGRRLVAVDRERNVEVLNSDLRPYRNPRVSPDGSRIAVEVAGEETQIWIHEVASGLANQLTFEGTLNQYPVWSPDGENLVFSSNRRPDAGQAPLDIFRQSLDAGIPAELIHEAETAVFPMDVSGDGHLAYLLPGEGGGLDIFTLDLNAPQPGGEFVVSDALNAAPRFSPDGEWIAYTSNESGEFRTYLRPFPGTAGEPRQIADEQRFGPVWSPDGEELVTLAAGQDVVERFVATPVDLEPLSVGRGLDAFSPGEDLSLFLGGPRIAIGAHYDFLPDGRLVFVENADTDTGDDTDPIPPQIIVVENWIEELKERVPVN